MIEDQLILKCKKMNEIYKDEGVWSRICSFIQSVLAALFGVQSARKREQDFEEGGLERMIWVAFSALIVFVIIILTMVSLALPESD